MGADITLPYEDTELEPSPTYTNALPARDFQSQSPLVSQRYEYQGLLGSGGMGEVQRVFDRSLNRSVAMKILHRKFSFREDLCARFVAEAQIGARLQHSNIVPIYEVGRLPSGQPYFTMKEIKGSSFQERIDNFWRNITPECSFRNIVSLFEELGRERGRRLVRDHVSVFEPHDHGLNRIVIRLHDFK